MTFQRDHDHVFDPEKGVWISGNLPMVDGVIVAPGYNQELDISTGLIGYSLPTSEDLQHLQALRTEVARLEMES